MKLGLLHKGKALLLVACVTAAVAGCNRNKQEAILKANQAEGLKQGDKQAAIDLLDEATRLDQDNHHIWYKLATVYEAKPDWPKMVDALRGAIKADELNKEDGTWATYQAKLGWALENIALTKKDPKPRLDAYEQAKEPYTKCIELDANYGECYHQLGNVYLWTDDEQKALEFYTKAIEHDPDNIRYYFPLAELYINLFMIDHAEKVVKEAKNRAKPGDKYLWGVHNLMAYIHQQKGDTNAVVTELEAAKAISDPDQEGDRGILILYNLGVAYSDLKEPKKQAAIDNLKGFEARFCKGPRKKEFEDECDIAVSILAKFNAQ